MNPKYKQYLQLNKNVLLAFAASITISAIVAQLLEGQQDYLNTTYTLIIDYIVYFTTFGSLYYYDNRKQYQNESGEVDKDALKKDLIKIVSSLGIAEVIYTVARWFIQYYLLTIDYDPYLASLVSQGISTIVYMIVLNLSVKITRLYKDGS